MYSSQYTHGLYACSLCTLLVGDPLGVLHVARARRVPAASRPRFYIIFHKNANARAPRLPRSRGSYSRTYCTSYTTCDCVLLKNVSVEFHLPVFYISADARVPNQPAACARFLPARLLPRIGRSVRPTWLSSCALHPSLRTIRRPHRKRSRRLLTAGVGNGVRVRVGLCASYPIDQRGASRHPRPRRPCPRHLRTRRSVPARTGVRKGGT